jgi:hypothetical protein
MLLLYRALSDSFICKRDHCAVVCHQTIDRPSLTLGQRPMRVPVKVPTKYAAPRELGVRQPG